MTPRPDYSPAMLRVFLHARTFAREDFRPTRRFGLQARADLAEEIVALTGLPYSTVRAAFAGCCRDDAVRAAIWAVLGHAPGAAAIGIPAGWPAGTLARPAGAPASLSEHGEGASGAAREAQQERAA